DPRRARVGALRHDDRGDEQRGQPEEQVEPEDAAPVPRADDGAADHRAERQREPGDPRPDPDRTRACALVGVDVPEHRQRARFACRGPQAHDGAPRDQHRGVRREGAEHGARAEHPRAGQHDLLAAELVPDHPAGQHDAGEREGISTDDPLQLPDACLQVGLQAAERDAHHGVVEERQEQQRTQRGESDRVGAGLRLPGAARRLAAARQRERQLAELHAAGTLIFSSAAPCLSNPQKTSSPTFQVPFSSTALPVAPLATVAPAAERSYFTVAFVGEFSVTESTLDVTADASGLAANALIAAAKVAPFCRYLARWPVGVEELKNASQLVLIAASVEAEPPPAGVDEAALELEEPLLEQAVIATASARPSAGARKIRRAM